jgi:dipeptidyl aminopeptidase/acylaminoacyl peptidase
MKCLNPSMLRHPGDQSSGASHPASPSGIPLPMRSDSFVSLSLPRYAFLAILGMACSDAPSGPVTPARTGDLKVVVNTTGIEADTNGYIVLLDGVTSHLVGSTDSTTFSGLIPGPHAILLQNLNGNCDVVAPPEIQVRIWQMTTVLLEVRCGWLLVQACTLPSAGCGLYRVTTDGSLRVPVNDRLGYVQDAAFSPDGRRILYSAMRPDNLEIHVVNRVGDGILPLTHDPGFDASPSWSPDGSTVVFVSDRAARGSPVVHTMNADGSGVHALTTINADESATTWFPDGQAIAFSGMVGGYRQILRMNSDGTNRQQLTFISSGHDSPDVSPDGSEIVFASDHPGNWEVFLTSSAGGAEQRITTFPGGTNVLPKWSPGGEYIAFTRQPSTGLTREGYLMKRDGSQLTRLNLPEPWVIILDWQPR